MEKQHVVTAIAPVNIATIKYWGKRDEHLILPLNDSISVTLSTDHMCAKTTVAISPNFTEDRIWLNGKEESIQNPRLQNCLKNIKKLARIPVDRLHWNVHICSENNFPTAAGLASSSAGYACLVFALSQIYEVNQDVSAIARQGSGSACRSMYGGFVRWCKGISDDGSDSIAVQLAPATHWPELRILILVVNDKQKKTSSTTGMQRSVETSAFLQHRIKYCVERHAEKMVEAITNKDFESFAEVTMRDSNQFHAVCMDTYPPPVYMNDTSHAVASFVHQFNSAVGCTKIAYTYDAGPNACLYVLENDVPMAMASIMKSFPTTISPKDYFKGIPLQFTEKVNLPEISMTLEPNLLKYIIYTTVGDGPKLLSFEDRLINEDGFPRTSS